MQIILNTGTSILPALSLVLTSLQLQRNKERKKDVSTLMIYSVLEIILFVRMALER